MLQVALGQQVSRCRWVAWAAVAIAVVGCAPDVVGGTREIEDCTCDCDLGCEGSGPRGEPDGSAGPQGAGGGADDVASVGPTASSASGPGGQGQGGQGQGGQSGAGGACAARLEVVIDDAPRVSCAAEVVRDAVTEVVAVLDDGHTMVVRFSGQEPAEGVCTSLGLRAPGNETEELDWEVDGACEVSISAYGERVVGTFAGTLEPAPGSERGSRVLRDGSFDVGP